VPRFLTIAIVLVTLACAAWIPVALANAPGEQTVPELSGSAGPTMDRVGGAPKSVALTVNLGFRSLLTDQLPATLARAELWFTRGAVVNGRFFPSCTAARLAANRRCPSGSRLGRAQIEAAVGTVADRLDVPLRADLYNGPGGRSVIFHFRASQPVSIDVPVQAPLVRVRERFYAYKLTVPVPENLQAPAGLETSVQSFRVTVKGTVRRNGRQRGWIETSLCPPGAQVPMRGRFTFRDRVQKSVTSSIVCGGQLPPG
jgi:hypothetical protein